MPSEPSHRWRACPVLRAAAGHDQNRCCNMGSAREFRTEPTMAVHEDGFYLAERVRRFCADRPHGFEPWKGPQICALLERASRVSGDHTRFYLAFLEGVRELLDDEDADAVLTRFSGQAMGSEARVLADSQTTRDHLSVQASRSGAGAGRRLASSQGSPSARRTATGRPLERARRLRLRQSARQSGSVWGPVRRERSQRATRGGGGRAPILPTLGGEARSLHGRVHLSFPRRPNR